MIMNVDTKQKLQAVLDALPGLGYFRLSKRGSPHVVMGSREAPAVSVVWFSRDGNYRTFWPWPSYGEDQHKHDWSPDEFGAMVEYIETVLAVVEPREVLAI